MDWRTLNYLAIYLVHMGETEKALETSEEALELSGRHQEALFRAALVYSALEDDEATLSLLEELIAKDSSYRQFLEVEFGSLAEVERFKNLVVAQ